MVRRLRWSDVAVGLDRDVVTMCIDDRRYVLPVGVVRRLVIVLEHLLERIGGRP